jgi:hypothetical protein
MLLARHATLLGPVLLVVALAAPDSRAGEPEPLAADAASSVLRDRVLVKLAREASLPAAGTAGPIGVPDFDGLVAELEATNVKPVFRRPPRGRRDPAAAAALGLDRWVRVDLVRERDDLPAVVERFASLRSVDVAEADRVVRPA